MIPGYMVALVTFPGVIIHEVAHQLFCRWCRVAVLDVCYLRVGSPAGYVLHEAPRTTGQHLLISIGPFLVNTFVGALVALPAAVPAADLDVFPPLNWLLMWLGISILMHAFPSRGDADSMRQALKQPGVSWLARLFGWPLVLLIWLGALGSMFWLDMIYAVAVAFFAARLVIGLLA